MTRTGEFYNVMDEPDLTEYLDEKTNGIETVYEIIVECLEQYRQEPLEEYTINAVANEIKSILKQAENAGYIRGWLTESGKHHLEDEERWIGYCTILMFNQDWLKLKFTFGPEGVKCTEREHYKTIMIASDSAPAPLAEPEIVPRPRRKLATYTLPNGTHLEKLDNGDWKTRWS